MRTTINIDESLLAEAERAYIDVHLLASAALDGGASLDAGPFLAAVAADLGLASTIR